MTREVVLKFLEAQLKKLKEEHVSDLMKANRVEELKDIAKELKFKVLKKFYEENKSLKLKVCEIPEGYHYELAFYICQSGYDDSQIFENYKDFIKLLEGTGEELGRTIAAIMEWRDLSGGSIEELSSGLPDEDDEE